MGDYADWKQTERIIATEGGKSVMNEVKSRFFGREIVDVRFTNEITGIGVTLAFASGDSAEVRLPELSLDHLMGNGEIAAQERELYFQEYPDRRPNENRKEERVNEPEKS